MPVTRTPRYLELASTLRHSISSGEIDIGDQLPTEHALCEAYDVSRHTARAALQVLEEAGLIERRPGLGTRVIANAADAAFHQPLGGLEDLLQYARDAQLVVAKIAAVTLDSGTARRLGAPPASAWLKLTGVRRAHGEAIAATTIYVLAALGIKRADLKTPDGAVTELIEKNHGVSVARIEQSITACAIEAGDARILETEAGSPALRTIRRYFDDGGRLYVISDTIHPADRFVYEMTYLRQPRREG